MPRRARHYIAHQPPDEIYRRPELYQDYTTDLAKMLATRLYGDNQEAVDAAVARAQGKAKEYAELTVELAKNNTSRHHREKGSAIDITNHSSSDETKMDYRRKIVRDYSNGDENFSSSLAKPEANDIPHHKVGDKR